MNNDPSVIDYAILVLLVVVLVGGWLRKSKEAGEANPINTKQLSADVHRVDKRLKSVEVEVQHVKDELDGAATKQDIERVEQRIKGDRELAQTTAAGVRRIEDFLIQKGLGGK